MTQAEIDANMETLCRLKEAQDARRAIKPDDPSQPRKQGVSEGVVPMPGAK